MKKLFIAACAAGMSLSLASCGTQRKAAATTAALNGEWKEYTLTFVPGENYNVVPDLKCHLLKLQFFAPEKESGRIWLDNVDYRILEVK